MADERIVPEMLSTREQFWGGGDQTWRGRLDPIRSEHGGFKMLGTASSADFSSQLTKTDLQTGKGTLASGGMRFRLKHVILTYTTGVAVTFLDSTTTMAHFTLEVGSALPTCREFDVSTRHFSTDCRVVTTTGDVGVTIGGIRETILA